MLRRDNMHGQTAIEYLTYFAFFLLVAAVFSSFIFMQSSHELSTRSQERFKSTVIYISQTVRDANQLALHADAFEMNTTLPAIVKGTGITIEGDEGKGLITGNTTMNENNLYYYVKIGVFKVQLEQGKYGDNDVLTIDKQ